MATERWAVSTGGPDCFLIDYGDPLPCCGCILVRLADSPPITCDCACHQSQRRLGSGR